jgi:hypothetical protein
MQFALLIYESPEAFAARKSDGTDPYTGAWRAYHKDSMLWAKQLERLSATLAFNVNRSSMSLRNPTPDFYDLSVGIHRYVFAMPVH